MIVVNTKLDTLKASVICVTSTTTPAWSRQMFLFRISRTIQSKYFLIKFTVFDEIFKLRCFNTCRL